MGVDVNKTGSDNVPLGVERPFGTLSYFSNLGDPVTLNRNIGTVRWTSNSINNRAVFDHNIIGQRILLCGVKLCPLGVAGSRGLLCAIRLGMSMITRHQMV